MADDLSGWTDFLAAEVGATAALLGLFFVSLSLNLNTILAGPGLAERAAQALVQLLAGLLLGLLLLMPGQTMLAAGIEALVVATVTALYGTVLAVRSLRKNEAHRKTFAVSLVTFELSLLPWFVGALLLMAGNAAGAYWLAVGICLSIAKAALDSWVFLVEINR